MPDATERIKGVVTQANYYFSGLGLNFGFTVIIDVIIVAAIFYWVYLFLRQTRAIRILYGFLILIVVAFVAKIFNLILLNFILKYLTAALVVAVPIVFQPELRQALEKLGRPRFFADLAFTKDKMIFLVDQICQACKEFSASRIGALIVIQRQSGLKEYIENGVVIDAKVTVSILQTIFFPKSPLHDGAVIVVGDRIVSASSVLPVAEAENSRNLGTRHRAAIGVTQNSDAVCVVVSEETGSISLAVGGVLERRITIDRLRSRLIRLLRTNVRNQNKQLFFWLKFRDRNNKLKTAKK